MNLERLERLEQILFLGRYEVNKETGEVYSKYLKRNLSACADGDGYLFVNFSYGTKRYAYKIHELVAYINGIDILDSTVNHIDGNVLNNHPSNLESLSREDNIRHRHSLAKIGLGGTPINPERTRAIKCCYRNGFSIEELASVFSTTTQAIELALRTYEDVV